ncbi:MAG: hypothetical protein N2645_14640 [Clostridia bacterium]|nr:hypothetical protein [Clostridia bacterium]
MLGTKTKQLASLLLSTFLIATSCLYVGAVPEEKKAPLESLDQIHATGYKPHTNDDIEWLKKNAVKAKKIAPNQLGLERINKDKKLRGEKELDLSAVPLGEEVVSYSDFEGKDMLKAAPETSLTRQSVTLPSHVDNSELPYFPPIRNQGGIGSCTAFSSTYYQMTHMTAMARGWNTKNDSDNINKFSPKWPHNMNNGGDNSGSGEIPNYRVLKEHGAALWADFPYSGDASDPKNYREWCTNPAVWRNAANYKIDKMGCVDLSTTLNNTFITSPTDEDLTNIKGLLNNGYVLVVDTGISYWITGNLKNDPSTPADDAYANQQVCLLAQSSANHSMTVVGYDDTVWSDINNNNIVDPGEKGAFKIANSWGTGDGNNGFRWFAYDALNKVSSVQAAPSYTRQFGWDNNRAYWITAKNPYTPKLLAQFTLNHRYRSQVEVSLGYSDTTKTTPDKIKVYHSLLYKVGGNYAFDGSTTPCDGIFTLDYSDLIEASENLAGIAKRWYVIFKDHSQDNIPLIIKDFKLVNAAGNVLASSTANFPIVTDGGQSILSLDYTLTGSTNENPAWKYKTGMSSPKSSLGLASSNGKLYAIGGYGLLGTTYNTVEEYNPSTDSWTTKTSMPTTRHSFGIAEVNGKIYVMGGLAGSSVTNIVEEYNPQTNTWTTKAPMPTNKREFAVAVLDGKIYTIGGGNGSIDTLSSVEEYNPQTNTWTTKASLNTSRKHISAAVSNGKIYTFGGLHYGQYYHDLKSVEEYNPTTNTWTFKADMSSSRQAYQSVEYNGKIYILGGVDNDVTAIYDTTTNTWDSAEVLPSGRCNFGCAKLNNRIYLAGGTINSTSSFSNFVNTLLEYVPQGTWTVKTMMPAPMPYTASSENAGKIYVTGGFNTSTYSSTAIVQAFDPQTGTWAWRAPMNSARKSHGSAALNNKIYVVGGFNNSFLNSVEEYDPSTNVWTTKANMPTARHSLGVAAVNGKLYALGGIKSSGVISNEVEEYNPLTNSWISKGTMPTPRESFAIAVVNNKIYVIGGTTTGAPSGRTNLVQEYDPSTNTWTTKSNMPTSRDDLAAATAYGKIYAIGGMVSLVGETSAVEEFDPISNTWNKKAGLLNSREGLSAATVNEKIFAIGGWQSGNIISAVEEFIP